MVVPCWDPLVRYRGDASGELRFSRQPSCCVVCSRPLARCGLSEGLAYCWIQVCGNEQGIAAVPLCHQPGVRRLRVDVGAERANG